MTRRSFLRMLPFAPLAAVVPIPEPTKTVIIRYPSNWLAIDAEGNEQTSLEIAEQIGEQITMGCNIVLPTTRDEKGEYAWDIRTIDGTTLPIKIERSAP